jgi:hypothetical protein
MESKAELQSKGQKVGDKLKGAAGDAGAKLSGMLSNNKPNITPLSDAELKQQETENEVIFFIFILVGILIFAGFILASQTWRVYTTLHRLTIYSSNEIQQQSIVDLRDGARLDHKLRDYYIASAYRPYVCYYHKYDYCSIQVLREVLQAGPRMIELEIFNDGFSKEVEPVVSVGEEKGDWKLTLNTLKLTEVLKVIVDTVFNYKYVRSLKNDPFIIYLNLKVNRNLACLEKIHRYIYEICGNMLLSPRYSYNADKDFSDDRILNITFRECQKKIILFSSPGFEDSPLQEIINYSGISNYTLQNYPDQYRILHVKQSDVVEKEEDIEEYANDQYFKITKANLVGYSKCSYVILSPEAPDSESFFDGITPYNPEPGKGLECGSQFIMMNYQKIDTNMSNYMYIFKDSSFVEKADNLKSQSGAGVCSTEFMGQRRENVDKSQAELNYTYTTPHSVRHNRI